MTTKLYNAHLDRILDAVLGAETSGVVGRFNLDHSALVGGIKHTHQTKPTRELLATAAPGVAVKRALHLASYADPATMRELVRGYRLALKAGLLDKKETTNG